jgi:hypothetical protein
MSIQSQIFLRLARLKSLFLRTAAGTLAAAATFVDFHQLL